MNPFLKLTPILGKEAKAQKMRRLEFAVKILVSFSYNLTLQIKHPPPEISVCSNDAKDYFSWHIFGASNKTTIHQAVDTAHDRWVPCD